jgi:flagellar protein FlaG
MHPLGTQPTVQVQNSDNYRDNYANSVQVRASLWDFFLLFGTVQQASAEEVNVKNYQGVYLSPQQAKALSNVLAQNIQQYEATFGEIHLQPQGGEARILQ